MTRPLQKHLDDTEIDQFLWPTESAQVSVSSSELAVGELQRHVDSCEDCNRKLQMHRRVQSKMSQVLSLHGAYSSSDCPANVDWLRVASGMMAESETRELMEHASRCVRCGPMLRQATEFLLDEITDNEERVLAGLRGSQRVWQREMSEKLSSSVYDTDKKMWTGPWNTGRLRLRWGFAAVAFALVLIAVWIGLSKFRANSVYATEKLLAQAYMEHRTLELRIPYTAHSDYRQRRLGEVESFLSTPESLRRAADRIASALKKNPYDPHWLLLSAQVDLLDWRYTSAFTILNKIDTDDANARLTRALALYEKAEVERDPQAYGEIVNLMGRTLQATPDDSVALFNQAVACEKLYIYECSKQDYERLLSVDKDSGWSAEARARLNRIEEKKTPGH